MIDTFHAPLFCATLSVQGDLCFSKEIASCFQLYSHASADTNVCYALSTGNIPSLSLEPVLQTFQSLIPAFRWPSFAELKKTHSLESFLRIQISLEEESPQLSLQIPKECIAFLDTTNTELSFVFKNSAEKKATELLYKGKLTLKGENLPLKETERIFGTLPAFQNRRGNTDFCIYEGNTASCLADKSPAPLFFEKLLEKSKEISRLKAEYGAKSTINLMIYPKDFFDFDAQFILSPGAVALARATDSELWMDISGLGRTFS